MPQIYGYLFFQNKLSNKQSIIGVNKRKKKKTKPTSPIIIILTILYDGDECLAVVGESRGRSNDKEQSPTSADM